MSSLRKLIVLGTFAGATLVLGACTAILGDFSVSSSASDDDASGDGNVNGGDGNSPTDSGADGPAPGTFTFITVPASAFVQPAKTQQVQIAATLNQFSAPISVTVTGLPAGVTAAPLTIAAGAASGELVLTAAASATVGATAKASVAASGGGVTATPQTLTVTVAGPTGTLDTGFPAAPPFTAALGVLGDALVQPDGKILLFGTFHKTANDAPSVVMRLNADATVDSTFTLGAVKTTAGMSPVALGVQGLLQADGKIVVAWTQGSSSVLNITRLTAVGTLDPTFGNATTSTVSTNDTFVTPTNGVVPFREDQNGSIVYALFEDSSDLQAWRFTSAGIPDPVLGTAGNHGNASFAKASPMLELNDVQGVFPDADGGSYFIGYGTGTGGFSADFIAHTSSTYTLDTTFGASGVKTGWEDGNGYCNVNEGVQVGNVFFTAGTNAKSCPNGISFGVATFTVASNDATSSGVFSPAAVTGLGCDDTAVRLDVGPNSTLLVAGFSTFLGGVPVVARYKQAPLGVDTTFGNSGVTQLRGAQTPVAVVAAPDGTTLVFSADATYPIQRVWP